MDSGSSCPYQDVGTSVSGGCAFPAFGLVARNCGMGGRKFRSYRPSVVHTAHVIPNPSFFPWIRVVHMNELKNLFHGIGLCPNPTVGIDDDIGRNTANLKNMGYFPTNIRKV